MWTRTVYILKIFFLYPEQQNWILSELTKLAFFFFSQNVSVLVLHVLKITLWNNYKFATLKMKEVWEGCVHLNVGGSICNVSSTHCFFHCNVSYF
jgi:hypothetical protein